MSQKAEPASASRGGVTAPVAMTSLLLQLALY
jgi:hypothetical protein